MRTTITLDEDVAAKLREITRERGISFKEAVNGALRTGLDVKPSTVRPFVQRTYRLGVRPGVNLDKALALASELEDVEILRKLELGK